MGISNSCIRHLNDVFLVLRGGSIESGHPGTAPAVACEGAQGTSSGPVPVVCDGSESSKPGTRSASVRRDVEDRIESSKAHWSQLTEPESDLDDEEVAHENRKVFEELQSHRRWGFFFKTFGYDTKVWQSEGEMEVGEKFAEGGQAELFHAKVTWTNPKMNEQVFEKEVEWLLKVFKKGTRLHKLQSQWPVGYLQWWAQDLERTELNLPPPTKHFCDVYCGTLLEDGRFAFLMVKEHEDLRSCIDQAIRSSIGEDHGPFSKDEAERIMFDIALGMDRLHGDNIVHRDLKASNVLVHHVNKELLPVYYVADFECSVGVVGTGFFRAPEILQAIVNGTVINNQEVFSKEADVYSYGMTCYEVLTGKLPFEGHRISDYDLVLNGQRPRIPQYVDSWMRDLLNRCWDVECSKRPSFVEVMKILSSNSAPVRRIQLELHRFEENYNREHTERLLRQGSIVAPE